MTTVLRYACLLGLGLGSLTAFISAGAVTGQMVMVDDGQPAAHSADVGLWVLGLIMVLGFLSLFRFLFAVAPALLRERLSDYLEKFATIVMIGLVCIAFVVL